jgi:hypothetical protein
VNPDDGFHHIVALHHRTGPSVLTPLLSCDLEGASEPNNFQQLIQSPFQTPLRSNDHDPNKVDVACFCVSHACLAMDCREQPSG